MDLSPLIALAVPLAGCVLAAHCGLSAKKYLPTK